MKPGGSCKSARGLPATYCVARDIPEGTFAFLGQPSAAIGLIAGILNGLLEVVFDLQVVSTPDLDRQAFGFRLQNQHAIAESHQQVDFSELGVLRFEDFDVGKNVLRPKDLE